MSEHFDPYADWLGIRDPARPVSHYQLLGVADFEDNALAIAVGADTASARLKACDPGSRTGRWQQLQDEVTLARLCLLDAARKRQYDEQLRKRLATSKQAVEPAAGIVPSPVLSAAIGEKAESEVPRPSSQSDFFPPSFRRPQEKEVSPQDGTSREEDSSKNRSAFPTGDHAPAPLASAAIPSSFNSAEVPKAVPLASPVSMFETRPNPVFIPADDTSDTFALRRETKKPWSPSLPLTIVVGVLASGGVLAAVYWNSVNEPPMNPISPQPEVVNIQEMPAHVSSEASTATEPSPQISATSPTAIAAEPIPQPSVPAANPIVTPPDPAKRAEPMAKQPETAMPNVAPTAEETLAFENGFRETVGALRTRNLDRAKTLLQQTKLNAKSEEQQQRYEQLEHLHGYSAGFWKSVRSSFNALQATDTLPVGDTEVAIVEIDGDRILIRDAGQNKNFVFSELPAEIVIALAAQWFDAGKPANKLYLGAFYAIDAQGDLQKARELWQEASAAGASADTVMPLLNDPAITTPNR